MLQGTIHAMPHTASGGCINRAKTEKRNTWPKHMPTSHSLIVHGPAIRISPAVAAILANLRDARCGRARVSSDGGDVYGLLLIDASSNQSPGLAAPLLPSVSRPDRVLHSKAAGMAGDQCAKRVSRSAADSGHFPRTKMPRLDSSSLNSAEPLVSRPFLTRCSPRQRPVAELPRLWPAY